MREGLPDDAPLLARLRTGDPRGLEELVTACEHRVVWKADGMVR
jgi:hypothetical protein